MFSADLLQLFSSVFWSFCPQDNLIRTNLLPSCCLPSGQHSSHCTKHVRWLAAITTTLAACF